MPTRKVKKKDNSRQLLASVIIVMFLMFFAMGTAIAYKKKSSIKKWWIKSFREASSPAIPVYHHTYLSSQQYEVHGIDISHHQPSVNWEELVKTTYNGKSIRFIFMKSTEGASHKDSKFQHNWKRAKELNLIRGAYHFYLPTVDPRIQAQHFITHAPLGRGDLPPVLDFEKDKGVSRHQLLADIKEWIRIVENHYGVKPIIYVNIDFFKRYIKGNFPGYIVWIAHYKTDRPRAEHHEWHFWQYTEHGKAAGIKGNIDLNVFNGTLADLNNLVIP
jgi:lysozyme